MRIHRCCHLYMVSKMIGIAIHYLFSKYLFWGVILLVFPLFFPLLKRHDGVFKKISLITKWGIDRKLHLERQVIYGPLEDGFNSLFHCISYQSTSGLMNPTSRSTGHPFIHHSLPLWFKILETPNFEISWDSKLLREVICLWLVLA